MGCIDSLPDRIRFKPGSSQILGWGRAEPRRSRSGGIPSRFPAEYGLFVLPKRVPDEDVFIEHEPSEAQLQHGHVDLRISLCHELKHRSPHDASCADRREPRIHPWGEAKRFLYHAGEKQAGSDASLRDNEDKV